MKRIIPILKNKYYIALAVFLTWMIVFDKNDIISQYQHTSRLKSLRNDREYYKKEILTIQKDIEDLSSDQEHLEKFAREKYLMKKDNEDVFVIVKKDQEKKK